jgi:hypothetical protein
MDFRELLNKIDAVNTEAKKEPERLAFADAIDHVKDIKFTPPLPSGIKFSSANNIKFRGQDINDPKVKLALFQDELKNSPARLLGEIGSRIKPTSDAQMDLSGHIASLGEKLASGSNSLAQLSEPEKKLAIEAIKAALRGMELERDPDQSEYKDDEDEMESIEGEVAEGDGKPTDDNGDFVGDGKPTDEEILALADRYKQYEGGNGDSLLGGYIEYMTNTGVPYDSIEEEEWNKWREANPDKEFTMDVLEQEPENFPISKKFRDDLFKMYKGMPDEDDVHRIEDVISRTKENAELEETWFNNLSDVTLHGDDFYETFGWIGENEENIEEAEYQGRTVKLNKPMRGDVKKFKVYVKNPKGNVVKVNFGDPDMKIKKSNPARRRSFRARHNCDTPGPKHKARYWSCRKW